MNNKKALLVVFIAALLAFIAVFSVYKKMNRSYDIPEIEQQQDVVLEEPVKEEPAEPIQEQKEVSAPKPAVKSVKPVAPKVKEPVILPLKVEEQKEALNLEIESKADIMKDSNSNDIIIIKEFKSKSPAKYSFEGYGVQTNSIK